MNEAELLLGIGNILLVIMGILYKRKRNIELFSAILSLCFLFIGISLIIFAFY